MKYKINLILGIFLMAFLFGGCKSQRNPRDAVPAPRVGTCEIGDACDEDNKCKPGLVCESFFGYSILEVEDSDPSAIQEVKTCQSELGESCTGTDGADCNRFGLTGPYICVQGDCFKLQELAEYCFYNSDCVSTYCCDDICCPCAVGEIGPSGGYIFYCDDPDAKLLPAGRVGLEAAPSDQSTGAPWGCHGTTTGAGEEAVGKGKPNTLAILTNCPDAGIAARLCDDLVLGGHSDWFLPSRKELDEMYVNLAADGVGGFALDKSYWSSSEGPDNYSSTHARYLYFCCEAGQQGLRGKSIYTNYVRCVRAFTEVSSF